MTELTHERCSELLPAYAAGSLLEREQNEVDAHLRTCPDCSLELRGLMALQGPEIVPMTGPEREALGTAVRTALSAPPKKSFAEWLGRRVAPALGAVALVVLGVVAYVSVSDDGPIPAVQQGADEAEVETLEEADTDAAAPAAEPFADPKQPAGLTQGSGEAGTGGGGQESTADTAAAAGTTSQAIASRAGASFEVRDATFAEAGLDLGSLVPGRMPPRRMAERLALSAPDERLAQIVRDCAAVTVSTSPYPLVPSSAAYYADDVLVIGFVWVDEATGALNYELRGWRSGECDRVTPIYTRGSI